MSRVTYKIIILFVLLISILGIFNISKAQILTKGEATNNFFGLAGQNITLKGTILKGIKSSYSNIINKESLKESQYLFCTNKDTFIGSKKLYNSKYEFSSKYIYSVNKFPKENIPQDLLKKYSYKDYTVSSDEHIIAFLLAQKKDTSYAIDQQSIQQALWGTSIGGNKTQYRKLPAYKIAKAYQEYKAAYVEPKFTQETGRFDLNNMAGPFSIQYNTSSIKIENKLYEFGNIKSAYIEVDNKKYEKGTGWNFTDANGETLTNYPASNENFYIKLGTNSDIDFAKKDVRLSFEFSEIDAKAYFIKMSGTREFKQKGFYLCSECSKAKKTTGCGKYVPPQSKGGGYYCGQSASGTRTSQPVILSGGMRTTTPITLAVNISARDMEITGTVWVDAETGKAYEADGIMDIRDGGDYAKAGVTVKLYSAENPTTVIAQTTTDEKGEYSIGVNYGKYYIEFEYNGQIYAATKRITPESDNTSKADETLEKRKEFNEKFYNIIGNGNPTDNLGKAISINNQELLLKYDFTEGEQNTLAVSKVNEQTALINVRTDEINATEEANLAQNAKIENINLGLVEREKADFELITDISKISSIGNNGQPEGSQEGLVVGSYFDNTTETLQFETRGKENTPTSEMIENKAESIMNNTYRSASYSVLAQSEDINKIDVTYKTTIINQGSKGKINEIIAYTETDFEVSQIWSNEQSLSLDKTETIVGGNYKKIIITGMNEKEILQNDKIIIYVKGTLNSYSETIGKTSKNFITEISKYTTYSDLESQNFEYQKYKNAVIEKDSQPENTVIDSIDISLEQVWKRLEDDSDAAPILNVSKSLSITGKVWQDSNGDGLRQEEEKAVSNIEVGLYKENSNTVVRTTKTDDNGEYKLLVAEDGNYKVEVTFSEVIYTPTIKDANENANDSIDSDVDDTSTGDVATDIAYNAKTYNSIMNNKVVDSTIGVAYQAKRSTDLIYMQNESKFNVDCGLKLKAETRLVAEKRVQKIKLTKTNGEVFLDATIDADGNITSSINIIKKLSTTNVDTGVIYHYYDMEISKEILNGMKLEIEYEIKIKNMSKNTPVKLTHVIDYVDNGLGYDFANSNNRYDWLRIYSNSDFIAENVELENNIILIKEIENGTILQPNGGIYTTTIKLNTTLSSEAVNMNYINFAEVGQYIGPIDPDTSPGDTMGHDVGASEEIRINAPTGETKINYIAWICIFVITTTGTIVIKKKFLK